jgi:hypothetical protein
MTHLPARVRLHLTAPDLAVVLGVAVGMAALVFLIGLPTGREQVIAGALLAVVAACLSYTAARSTTALARVILAGAVVLLPLNGIRRGGVTASDVLLVVAVALSLLDPGLLRRRVVLPKRFAVGFYGFVLAGMAGTLTANGAGVGNFARLAGTMAVAVVGMLVWRPDLDQVRRLAYAWLLGNTVSVGYALVTVRSLPSYARAQGLTTHPNALGLVCALSVAFAVFLYAAARGRGDRRVAVLTGLAAIAGMAVSGSRAGALAVVTVLAARLLLGRSFGAIVGYLLGGTLGWFVFLKITARLPASSAPNRLLHPTTSVDASDAERLGRLHNSIASAKLHPWFGSGFAQATAAHDVFFQVVVTAGVFGAAAFIAACAPAFGALWRRSAGPWRWLGLLPLAYFAAAVVSNNLWDRYVWFCLALGILAASRSGDDEAEVDERSRRQPVAAGSNPPDLHQRVGGGRDDRSR